MFGYYDKAIAVSEAGQKIPLKSPPSVLLGPGPCVVTFCSILTVSQYPFVNVQLLFKFILSFICINMFTCWRDIEPWLVKEAQQVSHRAHPD